MSAKIGKGDVHFQPNWLAVLVSVVCIVAAVYLVYWAGWCVPLTGAPKVLLVILCVLVGILVCFSAGMRLILELYSKGVWATPAEQKMTFPGDDLVKDPEGKPFLRVRQARDLDAPLEEVWKHVYQMDPTKGGMYAWSNCERLFGMNVDNAYVLEDMWQTPDCVAPGDFWAWSYGGFGAEVADLVPNKYITWFADSRDPVRTPGASYMLAPGLKYCIWYWTIALTPLNGGKRCRIYSCYDIAYGPHNPLTYLIQKLVIFDGGAMMGRRAFRNLELSARHERRKSIPPAHSGSASWSMPWGTIPICTSASHTRTFAGHAISRALRPFVRLSPTIRIGLRKTVSRTRLLLRRTMRNADGLLRRRRRTTVRPTRSKTLSCAISASSDLSVK